MGVKIEKAIIERVEYGEYIVSDPEICHGKLTFKGTRLFVEDVLNMISKNMDWDEIVKQLHGSITKEAIAEAVDLARRELVRKMDEDSVVDFEDEKD